MLVAIETMGHFQLTFVKVANGPGIHNALEDKGAIILLCIFLYALFLSNQKKTVNFLPMKSTRSAAYANLPIAVVGPK